MQKPPSSLKGYTTRDVADLLGLPEQRIRAYARAGFVQPARDERNAYLFSFQDLVLLRTAAELERQQVPARRISAALAQLRERLPTGRSLSELRIAAEGDEVVVRESGEPPWNPGSGQFHFEFETGELAARVAHLAPAASARLAPAEEAATAETWYELGLELEAVSPAEAIRAYDSALALDDAHADARVNRARLLQEQGKLEQAADEYRRVLRHEEHAIAAYNLGVVLEDLDRHTDAVQAYARALAADPSLAEAHWNLARLHERQGNSRAAIRHFNGYRELMRARER